MSKIWGEQKKTLIWSCVLLPSSIFGRVQSCWATHTFSFFSHTQTPWTPQVSTGHLDNDSKSWVQEEVQAGVGLLSWDSMNILFFRPVVMSIHIPIRIQLIGLFTLKQRSHWKVFQMQTTFPQKCVIAFLPFHKWHPNLFQICGLLAALEGGR